MSSSLLIIPLCKSIFVNTATFSIQISGNLFLVSMSLSTVLHFQSHYYWQSNIGLQSVKCRLSLHLLQNIQYTKTNVRGYCIIHRVFTRKLLGFLASPSFKVSDYTKCTNKQEKVTDGWKLRIGKHVSNGRLWFSDTGLKFIKLITL